MKRIRQEAMWFIHNMIAHPLSQVLTMLGWIVPPLGRFGDWVHDVTVPAHKHGTGHG